MPRVQTDYTPGAEALRTTATPNIQTVQARFDPGSSKAFQLAEALGKAQPSLDKMMDNYERKEQLKRIEQTMQKESYVERFSKDQKDGSVTAVQVGEKFPETVPIVRAQVAQAMGEKYGRESVQPFIQEVLNNEQLRFGTEERAKFLKGKRDEFINGLKGDDFYKSGAIAAYDKEVGQYENTWQRETAQYQTKVLEDKFSSEVGTALGANPENLAMGAKEDEVRVAKVRAVKGALEKLDETWKKNNGLSNMSRNELVVKTITQQAFATRNSALLDMIPDRFLNAQSKAEIEKTKGMIQNVRMSDIRDYEYMKKIQEEENIKKGKLGIIQESMDGKDIDPGKYANNVDLFNYALAMKDTPRLPEAKSVAAAHNIRTDILDNSTLGSMSQADIEKKILDSKVLNPREKQDLIKELPKLMDGRNLMEDPMVNNAKSDFIDPALKRLESSSNARIASLLDGTDLRGQAMASFQNGIRNRFMAYYEDHKEFPKGETKYKIIVEERDKAMNIISEFTKINGGPKDSGAAASGSGGGTVRKFNPATGKIE